MVIGRRAARAPWGVLGALVLIVATEWALAGAPLRFVETASLGWRLSLAAVDAPDVRAAPVVFLGDSLVKIGVMARVVAAELGAATPNLAMGRASAPATYFLFRRLLKAGARPKVVVVDFKPSLLAGGPRFGLRQWQEVLDPAEAWELSRAAGGWPFLAEIALGRCVPSVRLRWEVREAIVAALGGRVGPTYRNNRLAARNWERNGGTHLNGSARPFDGVIRPESRRKLIDARWACHRANAAFVERFLALADAHGIAVVWLIAPSSPELQALREREGGDAEFAAFVADARRRHPTLAVIDGRFSGYPTASFSDATHLNGRGAATLSAELARLLRRPGDLAARWTPLPPFRDHAVALTIPTEEVEQSAAAIDAELLRR